MELLPRTLFYIPTSLCYKQIHSSPLRCSAISSNTLTYGPSLSKGEPPIQSRPLIPNISHNLTAEDDYLFNEDDFTRVFNVSALRVPAGDCSSLESKLRGHLLNWPRIRNIARVPGDEIDEDISHLLNSEDTSIAKAERRIHGKARGDGEPLNPILRREQFAKEFNAKGYARFRNLAKISRPKKKPFKHEEKVRKTKNDFAVVEVVGEEREGEEWKALLGDGGRRNHWRGSTRLLLLDENYADNEFDELPQAIKAAFQEVDDLHELVKCKLTLHYDYWPMNEVLEALLPNEVTIPSSFESVGHIAHLNLKDELLPYKRIIAKVVLNKNSPKIRTVVNKTDIIQNEFRTMQLEVLAGNHSLVTLVTENSLRFHVDLANVFWNSRLATERQRLSKWFTRDDVVCDVFAGVGPISLAAARVAKRVYANDLNPEAVDYLTRNCVENRLERKVEVFNMDGRRFINYIFESERGPTVSHVVMNLPARAVDFLDAFRGVLKGRFEGNLPWIHVYGFSRAEDPEFDFHERIRIALEEVAVDVQMHKVVLVSPGKWMLCASFILPSSVAYAG